MSQPSPIATPTVEPPLIELPLIELRGASIGYDGVPTISGIDATVVAGEVVAILGANGSGKSTLVRGILGLADLYAGSIDLFGVPAKQFRERWRIGYVPQRTAITGSLPATVQEIVTSGRLPRRGLGRRLTSADRDAVAEALATVELTDLASTTVTHLSGGQQRRVSIARALAAEPELLILDEPTAGVDAENQARLAATLAHLAARGTTIVLVAHELGPSAPLVSRVIVMADGGIRADGAPDDVARRHHVHEHDDEAGCEHQHEHGEEPIRPGTGLMGW